MTLTSIKASAFASSLLLLVTGVDVLRAQQSSGQNKIQSPSAQALVLEAQPSSRGCPVSMQAKQGGLGDLDKVRHFTRFGQTAPEAMQQISLTLQQGEDSSKIVAARVAVRGTSSKGRTIPTASSNVENADKSTIIDVRFVSSSESASAKLFLEGFTSVTSITLKSLTYKDGEIWTPSEGATCRTIPDPLVLVAAP